MIFRFTLVLFVKGNFPLLIRGLKSLSRPLSLFQKYQLVAWAWLLLLALIIKVIYTFLEMSISKRAFFLFKANHTTNQQTDSKTDIQTLYRQTDKQTNRQTDKRTNRKTDKQTNRQTDKQTNRQTGKQKNRQTDKQTNRQTDKQKNRKTEKQKWLKIMTINDSKRPTHNNLRKVLKPV